MKDKIRTQADEMQNYADYIARKKALSGSGKTKKNSPYKKHDIASFERCTFKNVPFVYDRDFVVVKNVDQTSDSYGFQYVSAEIVVRYTIDDCYCAVGDNVNVLAMWYFRNAIKSIMRNGGLNSFYGDLYSRYMGTIQTAIINDDITMIPDKDNLRELVQECAVEIISIGKNECGLYGGIECRRACNNAVYRVLYHDGRLTNRKSAIRDIVDKYTDIDSESVISIVSAFDGGIKNYAFSDNSRRIIYDIIQMLPAERKKVFMLHKFYGLSVDEIVEKTGKKRSNVTETLSKAYRQINAYADEHISDIRSLMTDYQTETDEHIGFVIDNREDISTNIPNWYDAI